MLSGWGSYRAEGRLGAPPSFIPVTNRDRPNAIESINYRLRKVSKTGGQFPTDNAVHKIPYLAPATSKPEATCPDLINHQDSFTQPS